MAETDAPASSKEEEQTESAGVGWLELFFDLVFVATLSLINEDIREDFTWQGLTFAVVAMAGLFAVWLTVTLISNRFPNDGEYRRSLVGVIMVTLIVSGLGISDTVGIDSRLGQFSFAVTLVAVGALLIPLPKQFGASRSTIHLSIGLLWSAAAVVAVFALLPVTANMEFGVVAAAVAVIAISVAVVQERGLRSTHGVRPSHLIERLGLLAIILLGEGFVLLTVALREPGAETDLRFLLMTFILVYLLWRYFFDSTFADKDGALHWRSAAFGTFILIFGIIGMFDIFTDLASSRTMADTAIEKIAFAVASTLTFAGFAILGFARTGRFGREFWLHLLLAAVNLGFIAILIGTGVGMAVTVIGTALILAIDVVATVRSKRGAEKVDPDSAPLPHDSGL
jgi:low temperature requirement protein LtrA